MSPALRDDVRSTSPARARRRIHLLAHANPLSKDLPRLGMSSAAEYISLVEQALPADCRLTASRRILAAQEDERQGGRRDDDARIADVNNALRDPDTAAIVAASGGGWFSRIVPHLDLRPLARRRAPLWMFGFSEMTTLVNLVASYRCGRGVYWLCPNYLAWKVDSPAAARDALSAFWRRLPAWIGDGDASGATRIVAGAAEPSAGPGRTSRRASSAQSRRAIGESELDALFGGPLRCECVAGRPPRGPIRIIGGCLSVLVTMLAGRLARRLRPDGRWLAIEDVNEAPYRIDRYLATLKLAGWFERVAGVLLGDFHSKEDRDQRGAVLELLRRHAPARRRVPILCTRELGHRWPMRAIRINAAQPVELC